VFAAISPGVTGQVTPDKPARRPKEGLSGGRCNADGKGVNCRICGAGLPPGATASTRGCRACDGSPACTRCGHPRKKHRGAFGGSRVTGCTDVVLIEGQMRTEECACPDYTADPEVEPILSTRSAAAEPARDLFDAPMFDEAVAWRPY
jgi:hypothetical protein